MTLTLYSRYINVNADLWLDASTQLTLSLTLSLWKVLFYFLFTIFFCFEIVISLNLVGWREFVCFAFHLFGGPKEDVAKKVIIQLGERKGQVEKLLAHFTCRVTLANDQTKLSGNQCTSPIYIRAFFGAVWGLCRNDDQKCEEKVLPKNDPSGGLCDRETLLGSFVAHLFHINVSGFIP